MKSNTNIYIGIGFCLLGIYMLFAGQRDESILYIVLGAAFIITKVSTLEKVPQSWRKPLAIFSWILIAISLFWFLYLVRTDQWR